MRNIRKTFETFKTYETLKNGRALLEKIYSGKTGEMGHSDLKMVQISIFIEDKNKDWKE